MLGINGLILDNMILSKTLTILHRREIGLYDLPSVGSFPGLGIGAIFEVFQISGMTFLLSDMVYSLARRLIAFLPRCFRCSMDIPSGPEDVLLGDAFIAFFTSSSVTSVSSPFICFTCLSNFLLSFGVFLGATPVYCLLK